MFHLASQERSFSRSFFHCYRLQFFMCIFHSTAAHRRVPRSSELVEFVTFFLLSFLFFLRFSPRRAQHKAAAEQRKKVYFQMLNKLTFSALNSGLEYSTKHGRNGRSIDSHSVAGCGWLDAFVCAAVEIGTFSLGRESHSTVATGGGLDSCGGITLHYLARIVALHALALYLSNITISRFNCIWFFNFHNDTLCCCIHCCIVRDWNWKIISFYYT